jgi:hypothetical protein
MGKKIINLDLLCDFLKTKKYIFEISSALIYFKKLM